MKVGFSFVGTWAGLTLPFLVICFRLHARRTWRACAASRPDLPWLPWRWLVVAGSLFIVRTVSSESPPRPICPPYFTHCVPTFPHIHFTNQSFSAAWLWALCREAVPNEGCSSQRLMVEFEPEATL